MEEEAVKQIRVHFDGAVEEVKRHFGVVAEGLESKIQALAEGHSALERRLDAVKGELRGEMKREFEETRALIRLSYTELERRIGSLESDVSELQTRMEAVETRLRT